MSTDLNKRAFLKKLIMVGGAMSIPMPLLAKLPGSMPYAKAISFYNLHTGEKLNTTFWENGAYDHRALGEINHLLRDFRQNEAVEMDIKVIELLSSIQNQFDTKQSIHVVSGYRSVKTNNLFRKKGRKVAKKSHHMQGKAVDFYLPGAKLSDVRKAAVNSQVGGVGYYPKSNFIHVDTGRVRYW